MRATLGSLFSGIGGFDLGFERAGFITSWQVEIEDFPLRVLESRFPHAQRFKDIQNCGAHNLERVDCITAGVPCQDVSVAGKRAGLAGERTGLFYEFARILRELRPAWFVFENVPGLFSSNKGRDFAEVLRVLMVECGYGISWRVLDSRYFGVAQRRRRVFIVVCLGKPCPPEILFEPTSGARDIAASKESPPDVAYALAASVRGTGNAWNTSYAISGKWAKRTGGHSGDECQNLVAATLRGKDGSIGGCDNVVAMLNSGGNSGGFRTEPGEHTACVPCPPPNADGVRDFARFPKGLDNARYRALGNAVTVSVAQWIAERIMKYMEDSD